MGLPDFMAMLWKEVREFAGHRRNVWTFLLGAVLLGLLPGLSLRGTPSGAGGFDVFVLARLAYALFSGVIVATQVAPDLVLHERVGRTMDYLLATRVTMPALFGAKILVAALAGYVSALLNLAVQLVTMAGGGGLWGRVVAAGPQAGIVGLGTTAALSLYVATVATFVGLRAGDQRSASTLTLPFVAALALPFALSWVHATWTVGFVLSATLVLAGVAVALAALGLALFPRERIASYLQE